MQYFKLGGAHFKKIAPSGGRRENFWGISCEKSRFYAKKSYFFRLRREARKLLGYFVWKITILRQKIIFFPILGGGGRWVRTLPPALRIVDFLWNLTFSPPMHLALFCDDSSLPRKVWRYQRGVIRIRKSKDRQQFQYNDQYNWDKGTNNDLQNTT
jgi:hypothetical protein